MEQQQQNSFRSDVQDFLRIARLNHTCGPITSSDKAEMFETMKDICDTIEISPVFQDIIADTELDYSKGLVLQLYNILIEVVPNEESINYGRFWVIITFLRHVFMLPIINNYDVDYLYLLDVLGDAASFSLKDWVAREGGLQQICTRCLHEPATNFIFRFIDGLLASLFALKKYQP